MSEPAVIVVRMLPPREVSPNGGWSWRERHHARQELRAAAAMATRYESTGTEPFVGNLAPVTLEAEIAWCCGRKTMDPDNAAACLKSLQDGIADVLWDGQDRHVTIGEVTQIRGEGVVTVRLRQD
jgi:hypothetical protein